MTRDDDPGHPEERLDAYRTGELAPAERERVEAHLATCERCRAELAATETWAAAFERGLAARREGGAAHEPDWAAQRAAIVARTSGRPRGGEGRSFWRWAPQAALVAVAAIVIGVVWRETGPDPGRVGAGADDRTAAPAEVDEVGPPQRREPGRADRERAAAPPAAPSAAEGEVAENRAAAPGAPEVEELGKADDAEPAAGARQEALADRAVEPAPALSADAHARFERSARSALAERDTTAARRALAFYRDTLTPGLDADAPEAAALADSLRAFLRGVP